MYISTCTCIKKENEREREKRVRVSYSIQCTYDPLINNVLMSVHTHNMYMYIMLSHRLASGWTSSPLSVSL